MPEQRQIIRINPPRSVQIVHMEVPCCSGLLRLVADAMAEAGADLPVEHVTFSLDGEILERAPLPTAAVTA